MQPKRNTITVNIRAQSVELLSENLATAIDLHDQVRQARWNVPEPSFFVVHELIDKDSVEVVTASDQIAESAGGFGGTAHGAMQLAAERTFPFQYNHGIAGEKSLVFTVAGSLPAFGQSASAAIKVAAKFGDADTASIFT